EGHATMRRRAILQGVEQKAELQARFVVANVQGAENLALHIGTMNTNGTAADFPTVQDDVVGLGQCARGVRFQQVFVTVLRAGEGMVGGKITAFLFVVLEHGEVHHPQGLPGAFEQAVFAPEIAVADLDAQRAHGVINDLGAIRAEEDQVAALGAGALDQTLERFDVDVLNDRRLQTFGNGSRVVDLDVGQALGAVDRYELRVRIDFAAGHGSAAGHAQGDHARSRIVGRGGEYLEVHVLHQIVDIDEFKVHTQIGLIGAVTTHGLFPRHGGELGRQIDALHGFEDVAQHAFEQVADFFLVQERGFAVDLGKFRLAVRTQVLVAEALGDLVVTVETGDHQHLLEELRRLRQREEFPGIDPRRHQVVTGALGRALGQHGRLDIDKAQF